jgi:hypothetical protein
MADRIKVTQVHVEAAYEEAASVRVDGLGVTLATTRVGISVDILGVTVAVTRVGISVETLGVTVAATRVGLSVDGLGVTALYATTATGAIYCKGLGATVAYLESTAPIYHRKFPVPPAGRTLQSQTGKRKFPAVV